MGQRIQVFLIARTATRQGDISYQCVGAFHHQWCYKTLPLRALYRFFALLQVRENTAVVRDELRGLCAWNTGSSRSDEPWRNPAIPCPFTVSLLSIAWTTDLEHQCYISNYSFGNGLIDATKDCWYRESLAQNDEGICVIDITDTSSPAYCFVRVPGSPILSTYEFYCQHEWSPQFRMQSLEPSVAYATDGQEMNRFADALDAFWALVDLAGYPVIPVCTLREVWPDAAADRVGPEQVRVPIQDDLPMPLDIVVSLYLGFSDKAFLATITRVFGEGQVHHAIGKAILPPYKGAAEDIHRRTIVIRSLLLTQRAFEYVLIPRWQLSPGLLKLPAYTKMADVCKVSHWLNEYMSIVGTQVPPDPLADETPAGLRAWVSQPLLQPLTDFLHPAYVLKSYLSAIKPFPNHLLDALWFALQELGETTFLDLSTICLSHKQVINLLNRSAEVEAVSLSGNPEIKSTHLPFIISSAPSLRRLHVMHTGLDNGSTDLHALLTIFPPMFRQLEGIMNPQLLSCSHTTNWPASFAFRHATRTSVEDPYCVSIPFFTPAQVVQALTQILPLAFQEHGYGESIKFWQRDFRLAAQTGANAYAMPSDGFPFYMAAPMFLHATLSCGTLRPGQPWGARPIVSVPMDAAWNLPLTKGWGSWVFHFDWDHRRHRHHLPGKNQWGFILYDIAQDHATVPNAHPGDTPGSSGPVVDKVLDAPQALAPDSEMPATSEAESLDGHADSSTTGSELEPDIYDGTVYDLRGFLRCMAAEGRPLPDVGAVERLENILNTRDPVTGELVCGFMSQDDVPQMEEMYTTAEEREAVYTKKYGGLTTDRWATMFPGRFVVRGKREKGFVVMEN